MAKSITCALSGWGSAWRFQIVDDVLDVTQTSEQLGKTAGKDTASEKATYPALFGNRRVLRKADALVNEAFAELESFGERADTLKELARYLVETQKIVELLAGAELEDSSVLLSDSVSYGLSKSRRWSSP